MCELTISESPDQNRVMFEMMPLLFGYSSTAKNGCMSQRHEAPMAMLSLKVSKTCFVVSLHVN